MRIVGGAVRCGRNAVLFSASRRTSLDAHLVSEAKNLNINISRAAEHGIAMAVAEERARLWQIENREAIAGLNEFVERQGLPIQASRRT
jgi:antitoxin CcdA